MQNKFMYMISSDIKQEKWRDNKFRNLRQVIQNNRPRTPTTSRYSFSYHIYIPNKCIIVQNEIDKRVTIQVNLTGQLTA